MEAVDESDIASRIAIVEDRLWRCAANRERNRLEGMIAIEEALDAEKLFKQCCELERSEAFRVVVVSEIEKRKDAAEGSGTDLSKTPAERAEHHRAYHLAKDLLKLVESRKAEAASILALWKEQQGEGFSGLPDDQNV